MTAVEADRRTAELIRANARQVDLPINVISARAETLTHARVGAPYDVIWLDPPYDVTLADLTALTDHLTADGWLVYNGLLAIERAARDPEWSPPPGWDSWTNKHGETVIVYAQRGEELFDA